MRIKFHLILIILVVILAGFLRLNQISSYMGFLGDEGRDVIVAKGILNGELTLLGPRSSAGDFYMGPFYYYIITPFLWLANYDPVGPAIMVALFGTATVLLIYFVGRDLFNKGSGLAASALYAVSPLVLAYSHSSWNPDILPFFALLLIYITYKNFNSTTSIRNYLMIGVIFGICLQLHYLSLILGVVITVYILIMSFVKHKKFSRIILMKKYLLVAGGCLISLFPFILFEFRHEFLNTKGILAFILGQNVNYAANASFFAVISQVFFRIFSRLVFDFPAIDRIEHFPKILTFFWGTGAMIAAFISIVILFFQKNKPASLILGLWLFFGVFLFGFYKKEIYDYLFTFIFPLPFLLIGNFISYIYNQSGKRRIIFKSAALLIFFITFIICLWNNPFRNIPNNQRDQTKIIAQFVISKSNNQPFNFALLSGGNSDHAYRYYFDILDHEPVIIENPQKDPERKSVVKQLFVVCEDIKCEPIGHPLWEVAGFGRAEIENVWSVSVVKVFKLVPFKG